MHRYNILFFLTAFFAPFLLFAQVELKVSAPSSVELGQQFKVVFELQNANAKSFDAPSFDDFKVLFVSSDELESRVGRKSVISRIHTYVLLPRQKGTFTIGSATAIVEGNKRLRTKALRITVTEGSSSKGHDKEYEESLPTVSEKDFFTRLELNKSKCFEQEEVIATYKLYMDPKMSIRQVESVSYPKFEGFVSQTVHSAAGRSFVLEKYNGRYYGVVVLQQWVILPQRSGKITISPAKIALTASVQRKLKSTGDPMQDFLNASRGGTVSFTRELLSNTASVEVQTLPSPKPNGFADAVGRYSVSAKLNPDRPRVGELMTVTVELKGHGNLKLLKDPRLSMPESFDAYEPKSQSEIHVTANGSSGSKTVKYHFVPSVTGAYVIPSIELPFFDPQEKVYRRVSTRPIHFTVGKGGAHMADRIGKNSSRGEVQTQEREPRQPFLNTDGSAIRPGANFAFSWKHVLCYFALGLSGLLVYIVIRRKRVRQADVQAMRRRAASKEIYGRLFEARRAMVQEDRKSFYDTLSSAVGYYLSDKLALPQSELNRSNLERKGLSPELAARWQALFDELEFVRFASSLGAQSGEGFYNEVSELIELTEKVTSLS